MLERYITQFTNIAKKMGRNYVANIALEYVAAVLSEEAPINDRLEVVDAIHKAYTQVFIDVTLPWSTAEVYKPEINKESELFPFLGLIENDPF